MRIIRRAFLTLAASGFTVACMGGLSGCDGKPADGTVIQSAGPQSEAQKAMHKKAYYDRFKKSNKKSGRR